MKIHYPIISDRQTLSHGTESWKNASEDNEWMIVQCATFSKSLNPRNSDKTVSDMRIRIQFTVESSFWISVSGCKLTILPDIRPLNWIVIISGAVRQPAENSSCIWIGNTALQPAGPPFSVIPMTQCLLFALNSFHPSVHIHICGLVVFSMWLLSSLSCSSWNSYLVCINNNRSTRSRNFCLHCHWIGFNFLI